MYHRQIYVLAISAHVCLPSFLQGEDWPTDRHDNGRSGVSSEQVDFGSFNQSWVWKSTHPPQVAWPGPAKWDAYANIFALPNMRDYDHSFGAIHVGDSIYFGSSADDTLYCLSAETGEKIWTFTANGPIRMAPTYHNERIYFGSDDGAAYCLLATTGKLIWKFEQPTGRTPIINNGRLISALPCRTGVIVQDDLAIFGFGLLPWQDSHLVAVNAKSGKAAGGFHQKFAGETFEGPMAIVGDSLIACRGRVPPMIFDRTTGAAKRVLATGGGGAGGSFLASTPTGELLHGPGNKSSTIVQTSATAGKPTAAFNSSRCAVAVESGLILAGDVGVKLVDGERNTVWKQLTSPLFAAIVVGDAVVVGGKHEVRAFAAKDGKPIWRRQVQGVAYGLTFANGRLTVSTDAGHIYSFTSGGEAPKQPEATAEIIPPKAKTPIDEPTRGLLSHWVFELGMEARARRRGLANADLFVGDRLRKNDARMTRPLSLQEAGAAQALVFDGKSSVLIADDRKAMVLPTKEITVAAWVRVDQATKWGGFVGFIQDNGAFERGWLLGMQDDHFSFAVKSKGSKALTYLQAKVPFEKRRWYHVVGVYDGAVQRIYVNGKLAAEAKTQTGEIDYPTKGFFEIGAYHDVNENYPLNGQIHAIGLYNVALSPTEVTAAHEAKANWFPQPITLAAGPWWRFEPQGRATIQWRTAEPSPTFIKTTIGKVEDAADLSEPKTEHRVTLTNLPRQTVGSLTIETLIEHKRGATPAFDFDTYFNRSVPPSSWEGPDGLTATSTRDLLATLEGSRGLAVVVGGGNWGVAKSLVHQSEFRVLFLIENDKEVEIARNIWGLEEYGVRLSMQVMPDDLQKKLPNECFNLVVGSTDLSHTNLAIPGRGFYAVVDKDDWGIKQAEAKRGTGDWSHQYGLPSNSAFAGESLGGVSRADELQVRWIGRPGPRMQPDRSGRKPSPLAGGGRLYIQGMHRICAVDAANGTVLWGLEIPALERFNIPRDSGNWCCDDDFLYVAIGSHCWKIQGETGEIIEMFPLVLKDHAFNNWDWSYLARSIDSENKSHLIGSAVKKGTAYTNFWGGAAAGWYDAVSGPATFKICSENLFSLDPKTGKTNWEYNGGLIVNPTITIHNGRAYFVEARYPSLKRETTRRLGGDDFWKDQHLVALDLTTGKVEWEKKLTIDRGVAVFYLAAAKENLVITTSNIKQYSVYGFNSKNGDEIWNQQFGWPRGAGDHGKAMSRPAIVGDKLYVRPQVMDLATGKALKERVPLGGCGTYAATEHALIFRQSSITMWSPEENSVTKWSRLRPGCWLSTVPACGMVLSPEAGGGCSCGNWLEASIGFAPK